MATKQQTTFQGIMQSLESRNFAPIYILMGEESYYIDQIADYMANQILSPEEKDFNLTVCFGSDATAGQIADMARRYPMMAEHQVIIVKEAQNVRSLEPLEKYLRNPVNSTILVWCHKNGKIDARKKVISLAQAVGVVFESKKLRDYQLPDFIQNYLKARQATIDPKSTQMIVEAVGADLNRLTSELDKLLIAMPDNDRRITPELVEKEIGVSKEFNSFELRDAVIRKDTLKANRIIKYFDSNPKAGSLYAFLPLFFAYFQNLMIVHYAPKKETEADIAHALDMHTAWGARDYALGLQNYPSRKTMEIISKIREIDAKSKGLDNPSTSAGELMKELIFFILH